MKQNDLLQKYNRLEIHGEYIGLERRNEAGDYFCTPVDAKIFAWDNGIHYCFIDGFGEMVFCVNPETCCDHYVYPLAKNFRDFLRLVLATKNANVMQQIILWDKQGYLDFINSKENVEYDNSPKIVTVLNTIRRELGLSAMKDPFEYIKDIQKDFPYERIEFSDEFYEVTGIDRP